MRRPSPHARHNIRVGRLDLDLRGIAPDTAEAAARALGPALAQALRERSASGIGDSRLGIGDSRFRPADRIDAGRIESPASPEGHDLAARIAQRIAHALEREEP
jgi:hypothetical protein